MPSLFHFSIAALSVLAATCTPSGYQANGVSDAWLDTPVHTSDAPKLPQSTLTDWKTGLPSAAHIRAIARQKKDAPAVVDTSLRRESRPRDRETWQDDSYNSPGYWVASSRRHHRHHHPRVAREPYTRTVEQVGPSIVPQPPVPLSTRSYTGGPPLLPRRGVSVVPSAPFTRSGVNP